jgi:predicted DNA-binding transcriptional regulator YafY
MRIDRIIAIIVIFLNRERVSAKELSAKFQVSARTIYRDIDIINLAGIPVVSFQGSSGGFGILPNYKIDRQVLTLKDMLVILSALKGVNQTLENKELEFAIDKINSLVPKENKKNADFTDHFVFDIMPWGFNEDEKTKLKLLQRAVAENKLISFEYKNNKNDADKRLVEPMTLVFKGFSWYLFSFCRNRNDYRFFKLRKMKNVEVHDETFIKKEKKYSEFTDAFRRNNNFVEVALKFAESAKGRIEEYFPEENIYKVEGGYIFLKVFFPDDEWLYSYLLGFGEELEVLEPEHVRNAVISKTEKLMKIYKPS